MDGLKGDVELTPVMDTSSMPVILTGWAAEDLLQRPQAQMGGAAGPDGTSTVLCTDGLVARWRSILPCRPFLQNVRATGEYISVRD